MLKIIKKADLETMEKKTVKLQEEKKLLVDEIKLLKKQEELPLIESPIIVPMDDRSFLFIASTYSKICLPRGHKGFKTNVMAFLISDSDSSSYKRVGRRFLLAKQYFTTEGGFAYLASEIYEGSQFNYCSEKFKGKLLLEEIPEKETRIYGPLQQLARENNKAIIKVSFPKPMTREEVTQFIGLQQQRIDPVVEIIFE